MAQLPAQPARLQAHCCASLGLSFSAGTSGTTLPELAASHVLVYIWPAWCLGPCCPQGSHCPLKAIGGQTTSHGAEKN